MGFSGFDSQAKKKRVDVQLLIAVKGLGLCKRSCLASVKTLKELGSSDSNTEFSLSFSVKTRWIFVFPLLTTYCFKFAL